MGSLERRRGIQLISYRIISGHQQGGERIHTVIFTPKVSWRIDSLAFLAKHSSPFLFRITH